MNNYIYYGIMNGIILILFFILLIISTFALFDAFKDDRNVDMFLVFYAGGMIALSLYGIVGGIIKFM